VPQPLWLDQQLLREVPAEARAAPRKRRNRNFHASDDAACQRLLNAVEPETCIPPHRHLDPAKDETLVVLAGRVGLLLFDESGQVRRRAEIT